MTLEVVVRMGETVLDVAYVEGTYRHAGESVEVADGARIERGLVEITATRVERPARDLPRTPHGDRRALAYIAVSLAAHLVVWSVAPEPPAATVETRDEARARTPSRPPVVVRPMLARMHRGASRDQSSSHGGARASGEAGALGGLAEKIGGHLQVARRTAEPQIARASASPRGRQAGILASEHLATGIDAIVGKADLSSGFDRTDVHAPLFAGEGAGRGNFGLARSGHGGGGGCAGGECAGTIGAGDYRAPAMGTGTGAGYGAAGGRGGLHDREAKVPTIRLCGGPMPCMVSGALDKAIIRRYIRRELAKISYCYERELLSTPKLDGTVETNFLIAQDGKVTEATASGVNANVASCVEGVIRNIEFPRSREGATRVTYPFHFRQPGA